MILRPLPAVLLAITAAGAAAAEPWPQFRGPRRDGTSTAQLSDRWRRMWKAALPGSGHSSPSVWGPQVFVTSFEPETQVWRRLAGYRGRLFVSALDAATGRVAWRQEVPVEAIEKTTALNSPATPTPATDGARVYAYFGSFGLTAFTAGGRAAWQRKIGPYPHHMGAGSSPVLADDGTLYLNAETDGPSALYAVSTETGAVRWRSNRRTRQAGYASASLWGDLIVVAGHQSVTAYQRKDGREAWTVPGLSEYVVPTAVASSDLVFATSSGPGGSAVLALRADGAIEWRASRGAAYIASPVLAAGRLVTVNSNCIVSALEPKSGRLLRQSRLNGLTECYASPVTTPGRIHIAGTSGKLISIDADTFEVKQEIETGDPMIASPAVADGVAYLRGAGSISAYAAAAGLQ